MPDAVLVLPRRPSWRDNVEHYAAVVEAAVPDHADRARRLGREIAAGLATAPDSAEPTHGDFYETQLFVADGAVSGLLDIDTVGPGRRADDLACLVAHAVLLAEIEPSHAASTISIARRMAGVFERLVDAVDLRLRVAGVLMSLATGPHRVQDDGWPAATVSRLDLVQTWLDAADPARFAATRR